jgi:hypothetical protein
MDISGDRIHIFEPSTSTSDRIPVSNVVQSNLQEHLDIASALIPSTKRAWERKLSDLLSKQTSTTLSFLERPLTEWSSIQILSKQFGDSRENWFHSTLQPQTILDTIDQELHLPLSELQDKLHLILSKYKTTVEHLFRANESLHNKLTSLDQIQTQLEGLIADGEGSPELSLGLQTSILEYMESRYKSLDIQEAYETMCREYTKFSAYKSILQSLQSFRAQTDTTGSLCSICTAERIQYALIPCGHTFCSTCSTKQRSQCYICRSSIREKLKIYLM